MRCFLTAVAVVLTSASAPLTVDPNAPVPTYEASNYTTLLNKTANGQLYNVEVPGTKLW